MSKLQESQPGTELQYSGKSLVPADPGGLARLIAAVAILRLCVVAYAEFEFPAFIFGFVDAPEFKDAKFGDAGMERHGHIIIFRCGDAVATGGSSQRGFERIGFAQFFLRPAREQVARLIGSAIGRTEEAEASRFADDQSDGIGWYIDFCSFFHSVRHNAKCF